VSYVEELSDELQRLGIRGRLRRRIVTEFEDHLELDPRADLGTPADIARQFADELGTRRAFRAARVSFTALAIAGVIAVVAFVTASAAGMSPAKIQVRDERLGALGGLIAVLGGQIALASGALAALRAFRQRRRQAVTRRDAVIMGRRAAVGTFAGLATMAGMALFASAADAGVAGWWTTLVSTGAALGAAVLLAASPALISSVRLRPVAPGAAGDVLDDLGPLVPPALAGRPWRFALVFAAAITLAITAAGIAAGDPFDGALRGLGDGIACLAGFAALGHYLGLR
jgi:hypothetical protein